MNLSQQVKVTHGTFGVDAFAAPQTVPPDQVLQIPLVDSNGNPQRVAIVLDAGADETATVSLYAADDASILSASASGDPLSTTTLAARKFYLVKAALVLTAGTVQVVPGPLAGFLYIRMTADAMATGGTIRIGGVSAAEVAT